MPITNFGQISQSTYTPRNIGLPLEAFKGSLDKLEARYDKNLMFSEQLEEYAGQLKVRDHLNGNILAGAKDKLSSDLTTILDSGDLELSERKLMRTAKDFKNTDLLKEALEDYQRSATWITEAQEILKNEPDRMNAWQRYIADNSRPLARDENGNVVGMFNFGSPVKNPDIAGQALAFAKEYKADKFEGIDLGNRSKDISSRRLRTGPIKSGGYVGFGSEEFIDKEELNRDLYDYIMSKPENVAYLNEMEMLNNNLTKNIDITSLLNSVGVSGVDIANSLISQGVAKEDVYNSEILKKESELNSIIEEFNKVKNNPKKAQKLYDKYEQAKEDMAVLIEGSKDKLISNAEYEDELRRLYGGKYKSSIISSGLNAVANSQSHIKQDMDWQTDQYALENHKERLRREKEADEKREVYVAGESSGQSAKSLMLEVRGDGYNSFRQNVSELNSLKKLIRDKARDGKELSATEQERINELEGAIANYKATARTVMQELVNTGEFTQAELDETYRIYVESEKSRGGAISSGSPLKIDSKEAFYASLIAEDNTIFDRVAYKLGFKDMDSRYYSKRVATGLDKKIRKAKVQLELKNQNLYVETYTPIRPLDPDQAKTLVMVNNALRESAMRGELLSATNNMPLIEQIISMGIATHLDGTPIDKANIKFDTQIIKQRLPNGKVGTLVTLLDKEGTVTIRDKNGNPIQFVAYSNSSSDLGKQLNHFYGQIMNKALDSRDDMTRNLGIDMRSDNSLWQHIYRKGIDTKYLEKSVNEKFMFSVPAIDPTTNAYGEAVFGIGTKENTQGIKEYYIYQTKKSNTGRELILNTPVSFTYPGDSKATTISSTSPVMLGNMFEDFMVITKRSTNGY